MCFFQVGSEHCMDSSPKILVGTAGWSHNDWEGVFYPSGMQRRREHPLTFLAQCFDMVEISASFYGYIKPEWARVWARRVDAVKPGFKFTAKLHHSFTHAAPDMPGPTSAASIKPGRENEARVREGFDSLASIGKLAAVLAQFPLSFKNTPLNREYLAKLADHFSEYPLVVEVRDESWDNPDTIRYFKEMQIGFCNIDWVPSKVSLEQTQYATSSVGYVHLHGRHTKHDYLYRFDELKAWAEKIQNIARTTDVTYVVTNNSPGAKSVVSGLQLKYLLTGKRVSAPESLLRQFPELRDVADSLQVDINGLSA
jgi:uncharacterized protein YecE (DUF72 family)